MSPQHKLRAQHNGKTSVGLFRSFNNLLRTIKISSWGLAAPRSIGITAQMQGTLVYELSLISQE